MANEGWDHHTDHQVEKVKQATNISKVVQQAIGLSACRLSILTDFQMEAAKFIFTVWLFKQIVVPDAEFLFDVREG